MPNDVRQSRAAFERVWIDETVNVDAPMQVVHARLADIGSWPTWVPGMYALRRQGNGPFKVGDRFWMLLAMPPLPAFWVPSDVYLLRPDVIEWGGRGPATTIRHRFELTPLPSGGTRVRHVEYATNALALLLRPFEATFRRHDQRWTGALAAQFAAEPAREAAAA